VIVPGASKYLNAATLANKKGIAAQGSSLLSGSGSSAASLLDVGRAINSGFGPGLSQTARALNNQMMNNQDTINKLLSLTVGAGATVEGASTIIKALRSKVPVSQLSDSVREQMEADKNKTDSDVDVKA
jgi:hypothetical protein